ncbi:YlxR family protein, partial [Anaerolineales bacterium HSG24]|nr:YlxR family protein [Anaerolineales bacterium HSG24]
MAKHQPQRICIACRQKIDKRLLLRIVRTPEGEFIVDPTGKVNGRGAYICQQPACWQ